MLRGRRADLLATLVLGVWIPLALSGQTGKDLSRDVSRPLYHGMAGVSDPEGGLIDLIDKINDDPANIRECTGGGDGCKMARFIVGCIVCGSIVFPILTFLSCCGFCCGRTCCKCCGKHCCGENCGGKYPTRSYTWIEVLVVMILLLASILILFVFSGLGFTAFSEIKGDYDDLLDAGLDLVATPVNVIDDTNVAVDDIKQVGIDLFTTINEEFSVLDDVKRVNSNLKDALEQLRREMLALQLLVEGCDTSMGTCPIPDAPLPGSLPTNANPCVGGTHSVGVGALLSNGDVNPACRNPQDTAAIECPCCQDCQDIISDIDEVIASLPSDAEYDDLDQELDVDMLSSTIDDAMGDWDSALTDFEDTIQPVEDFVDSAKSAVTSQQVDGIAAGIFLLTWIVLICVLVAIVLSMIKGSIGDIGGYCWWAGFIIAVVYMVLIVLPMFGWMTAIALPMETVCQILPAPGETSGELFRLLEAAGSEVGDDVQTLIDDCVLATDGYIWGAANISRESLTLDLNSEFNVSAELEEFDVDSTLDAVSQTSAFNQSKTDSLAPSDYGYVAVCPSAISGSPALCASYASAMTAYQTDLNARIALIRIAAANVTEQVAALDNVATSAKGIIDGIVVEADEAVVEITDMIWDIGKCTRISNAYAGLRTPLCDGVAAGVFGTWGVLFIMAFFLYLLLYLVNKSAKMAYSRRHPEGNPDDKVHPETTTGEGEAAVVPIAAPVLDGGAASNENKLYPNVDGT